MDRRSELKCLSIIIIVFIAISVETDIFLPALPDMMVAFSATEGGIQSLLTWNFVGVCLAGPFYGPLSDSFGRRKLLMAALGLFLVGSVFTLFAQTLKWMLLGRILQGLGSGGCFTLRTAIIFDAFQKEKAIDAMTKFNAIMPLIKTGAPMLGGYLNYALGFRSNFIVIAVFVLASFLISSLFFEETLPPEKRIPWKWKGVIGDFTQVFRNLPFWQATLVISIIFGGYVAFLASSAVLFVVEFQVSRVVFPILLAVVLGGWVLGSLTLNRSLVRLGSFKVKKIGIAICSLGGLGLGVSAFFLPRNPYLATAAMTFYSFGANWLSSLYFPEAMEILPDIKGVASSLLTSARLLIAALVAGITGVLYNGTIYPMAAVMVVTVLVFLPTLILYEKSKAQIPFFTNDND